MTCTSSADICCEAMFTAAAMLQETTSFDNSSGGHDSKNRSTTNFSREGHCKQAYKFVYILASTGCIRIPVSKPQPYGHIDDEESGIGPKYEIYRNGIFRMKYIKMVQARLIAETYGRAS